MLGYFFVLLPSGSTGIFCVAQVSKNIKFLMSMVHAKISCPARWQTNKNLPSLRIFALGQIYLNESGRELPNPILK